MSNRFILAKTRIKEILNERIVLPLQKKVWCKEIEHRFNRLINISDGSTSNFTIAPQVIGMPARAFSGATFNLKCVNIPSGLTLTYQWFVGGSAGSTSDSLSATTLAASTKYSCKISTTDTITPTTPTGLPVTSAEVTSPTLACKLYLCVAFVQRLL